MEMLVIFWIVFTAFCSWVAAQKGRSAIGWLLIALLLSPLIAILALIAVPTIERRPAMQTPPAWKPPPAAPRNDAGFPDLPPRRDA